MISIPLPVQIPENFDQSNPDQLKELEKLNQERLKKAGDWIIMPRTIEYIAKGYYSEDENGLIYFKNEPIPEGLKL